MNRCFPSLLVLAWCLTGAVAPAGAQNEARVRADRVNVRSRPSLKGGEVITQLSRGQRVLVFEEGLPALFEGEPVTEWVRIELPAGTHVWVSAEYVDPVTNEVSTRLLNVRAGPSEDFAVLGRVVHGAKLSVLGSTNGWLKILAPRGLSGFVAAHLLDPVPPAITPAPEPPPAAPAAEVTPAEKVSEPVPGPSPSTAPPAPEPSPVPPPSPPPPGPAAGPETQPEPMATAIEPVRPPLETPGSVTAPASSPRRVVQREGVVRRTWSIQAPTPFELRATDTGRRLNYLWIEAPEPELRRFHGQRVRVTGEEYLEPGWATPLLRVEQIRLTQ